MGKWGKVTMKSIRQWKGNRRWAKVRGMQPHSQADCEG